MVTAANAKARTTEKGEAHASALQKETKISRPHSVDKHRRECPCIPNRTSVYPRTINNSVETPMAGGLCWRLANILRAESVTVGSFEMIRFTISTKGASTMAKKNRAAKRAAKANTKLLQAARKAQAITQFAWRRHWNEKVAPILQEPLVQASLNMGMAGKYPCWKPGDAPCNYSADKVGQPVPGTLEWYQPIRECHAIVYFALAIGVMIYPDLDWRIISGHLHTIAVGYDSENRPVVVMDILEFEGVTAEQSLGYARTRGEASEEFARSCANYDDRSKTFCETFIPLLKARARELQAGGVHTDLIVGSDSVRATA
jgi:hypothetical protein